MKSRSNDHKFIASISTNDIVQLLDTEIRRYPIKISNLQSKVLDDISQKIKVSAGGEIESATSQATPSVLIFNSLLNETGCAGRLWRCLSLLKASYNIRQFESADGVPAMKARTGLPWEKK